MENTYTPNNDTHRDAKKIVAWQYVILLYIGALIFFPNSSWGLLDMATNQDNIYYRGIGLLFLSIMNWYLIFIAIIASLFNSKSLLKAVSHNLSVQAKIFWAILVLNLFVGIIFFEIDLVDIFSEKGLLNIANMMLLFFTIGVFFSTKDSFRLFINFIFICGVARGLWGLIRFIFLGGDPANYYSNFQEIDIKLTFFDINDCLIASILAAISAWRLLIKDFAKPIEKYFYLGVCFLEIFIVMLSYRRTAWGGIGLIILLFAQRHPSKVYKQLLIAAFFITIFVAGVLGTQRVENTYEGDVGFMQIFSDVLDGYDVSLSTGRFVELYAAFLSYVDSPVVGLGVWGKYDGFIFPELFWHDGDFTWMHSGLLHITLKAGVIGLVSSLWVMWAFSSFCMKSFSTLNSREASIAIAGFGGFLFLLPDFLVGTPIIEFRTMQLTALTMVLPYLAYAENVRRTC